MKKLRFAGLLIAKQLRQNMTRTNFLAIAKISRIWSEIFLPLMLEIFGVRYTVLPFLSGSQGPISSVLNF